jgi:hypothetical protein
MGPFAWRSRFPKTLRGKATVNLLDSGQPWVPAGERSGLQTRIVAMESVSLCERTKSSLRFWNSKESHANHSKEKLAVII